MKSYPFRYAFEVPECKKVRVLISTDCKNEADDQFALVHALMTPKFCIQGVIAAHFGRPDSMQLSFDEINRVLDIMGIPGAVPVLHGAEQALAADGKTVLSEGAASIISEAQSDDPAPLYVLAWGPLTDVALAARQAPEIAGKVNLIWIGGAAWPQGGPEYNLHNDIAAANFVMQSAMPVQMITSPGFRRSFVSLAELEYKVLPCGPIGAYLFRQLVAHNEAVAHSYTASSGEGWCLGDSPSIGLLLNPHRHYCETQPAPLFSDDMRCIHDQNNRPIRIYQEIDARFLLEDFFAKLALNYGSAQS